ncbi:MAG: FAD-dependent oxidoreductase [Dehalococcoidia bacterium]|jgi:alkyl hydroperoxide reductase subunit F
MHELIIIGGGPAGMTAAVYAARKRLDAVLISKDIGGQPMWTGRVENYMGYQYIEGFELMSKFEEQVKQFPLEQKIGSQAVSLKRIAGGFEVAADGGEKFQAKAIIVASGKRPRSLNVPGEEKFKGKGVTYCAICDGPIFAGQKVAVIGGGNSALEASDDMSRIAEQVYVVSVTPFTGDKILIEKVRGASNVTAFLEHEVLSIFVGTLVEGIEIRDLKTREQKRLDVGGIFVEIGLIPNSELVKGLTALNEQGEIVVNCRSETNVPGLFAAGDVTNVPEKQIVISAGEGAKAALQAHKYLQRL